MSVTQIINLFTAAALFLVAVAVGIDTAITYYAKHTSKPLPDVALKVDAIAKAVVAEAATLNVPGVEKKVRATTALMNQMQAEGKPITEPVARGLVQDAYNKTQEDIPTETADDQDAKPIGFVSENETDDKNA